MHNAKCELPPYKTPDGKTIATPVDGKIGNWIGDRGNSKFQPKKDSTLYQATGGKPIEFVNGRPRFEEFSPTIDGKKAIVSIEQLGNHNKGPNGDFGKAVEAFRIQIGDPTWTPDYSKYTWHHHEDGKQMILIDRKIHNVAEGGVAHVGGVSDNPNL